jgi:hypothetical protein
MAAVRKFNERGAPRLKVNWSPSVKPKASQTSSSLSMEQPATFSTYGRSFESLPEAAGRPDGLPSWAAGDSPPGGVEVDGAGAAELQALISRAIALIARAG